MSPRIMPYDTNTFIVLFKIFLNSWIIMLNLRQLFLLASMKSLPSYVKGYYNEKNFNLAKSYQCEKILLSVIFRFYETFVFIAEVYGGIVPFLWEVADSIGASDHLKVLFFITLSTLFETIIYLPLRFFNTFVIEQRYGFNRQHVESFIGDTFKDIFAKSMVSLPVVWGTILTMRLKPETYPYYLMVFIFVFRVSLIILYLEVLFPLMANFKPLPEGRLKNQIRDLAAKVNFPLYDIYVMEASHKTTHGNAFFIGLGSKKMIVFFDSMLEGYASRFWRRRTKYTEEELLGILGHEMGHWYHQHILKALIVFQFITCIELYLCSALIKSKNIYRALGFTKHNDPPNYLGFLLISPVFLGPIEMVIHYFSRWMSRYFELEADLFSAHLDQKNGLISGLKKLSSESLKVPESDYLYSAWYDTHPTLHNRIQNLAISLDNSENQETEDD